MQFVDLLIGETDEDDRAARLEDTLRRVVSLAHAEGIDHPLLDEAAELLADSPMHRAMVEVAADICAGKPGTGHIACYNDMVDAARAKLTQGVPRG